MNEHLYKIALTLIKSVGPITAKNIVSYCGGVEAVFKESKQNLLKIPSIGPKTANEILDKSVLIKAENELKYIEKNSITTMFYLDDNYPSRLKPFDDSPILLFYQGNDVLNHSRTIGIVGTRKASAYGKLLCEKIIEDLKAFDVVIISGLAYGIDAVSHQKAVELSIPTIGIMGNGLDITYPATHHSLRKRMIDSGGILTEFPTGSTPEREHFPMRNRIIAGLSDALLVVESEKKGGSMITAQFAFSYNKDVFAVPGRAKDPLSAGPNFLIKSNIAALAESAGDIAYKMLWELDPKNKRVQLELFHELSPKEQCIIKLLQQNKSEGLGIDQIHFDSNFTMSELSAVLLELEFKNLIKSLPGSRFILK